MLSHKKQVDPFRIQRLINDIQLSLTPELVNELTMPPIKPNSELGPALSSSFGLSKKNAEQQDTFINYLPNIAEYFIEHIDYYRDSSIPDNDKIWKITDEIHSKIKFQPNGQPYINYLGLIEYLIQLVDNPSTQPLKMPELKPITLTEFPQPPEKIQKKFDLGPPLPPPPSKLKRLLTHNLAKMEKPIGLIFYVNGHSSIKIQKRIPDFTEGTLEIDYDKSYMMFLKNFGQTTNTDNDFNELMTTKINEYISGDNSKNYSDLYKFLNPIFDVHSTVCNIQQDDNSGARMSSLLRYIPLYTKQDNSYIIIPKKVYKLQDYRPDVFLFTRTYMFNSVFNVFKIFFTKSQIQHKSIPDNIIDKLLELNNQNLCIELNNKRAIKYFCIYFILIFQDIIHEYLAKNGMPTVRTPLTTRIRKIESDEIFNSPSMDTVISKYFPTIIMGNKDTVFGVHDRVIHIFDTIFKLQCVIEFPKSMTSRRLIGSIKTTNAYHSSTCIDGEITTDIIINFNNIFADIANIGYPIIISKSCNVNDRSIDKSDFQMVKAYFDDIEYHPGKLRKRTYNRKTVSVGNYNKSRTSKNRKEHFNKTFGKESMASRRKDRLVNRGAQKVSSV
jgi:hypothetical protein